MIRPRSAGLLTLLALSAFSNLFAQEQTPPENPFFFHDGDNPVVFLGDSITEQKMYTTLIETFVLSRYPEWKITFRNAGWSGDTAGLSRRGDFETGLDRDVLGLKPAAVTINFGMNDARGGKSTYSKFLEAETALVQALKKANVRTVLITPSPEERYEPDAPAGSPYNTMLQKYVDGMKLVADNEQVQIVDLFTPFLKHIESGRKAGVLGTKEMPGDPNFVRLTNEGVHPNWGGHLIMASVILKALKAPADISSVTIDASVRAITSSDGCTVELQDSPPGIIRVTRTDRSLPWPIPKDPSVDAVLKIPGFDPGTSLNRLMFKIVGLKEDAYKLNLDGVMVGTWTNAELAAGVNMGMMKTGPIYDQEQQLLAAVLAKNEAFFNRWRNVQLFVLPEWLSKNASVEDARKKELARLDAEIVDAEKRIEALRQPVIHTFRFEPVK